MSNIALQIERTSDGTVDNNSNVLFDSTVYSSGNISYNPLTGTITINETGRFYIDWWVATQSSPNTFGVIFAIVTSQGDFLIGNSPIKTTEVVGIGVIDVPEAPITLSLVLS